MCVFLSGGGSTGWPRSGRTGAKKCATPMPSPRHRPSNFKSGLLRQGFGPAAIWFDGFYYLFILIFASPQSASRDTTSQCVAQSTGAASKSFRNRTLRHSIDFSFRFRSFLLAKVSTTLVVCEIAKIACCFLLFLFLKRTKIFWNGS